MLYHKLNLVLPTDWATSRVKEFVANWYAPKFKPVYRREPIRGTPVDRQDVPEPVSNWEVEFHLKLYPRFQDKTDFVDNYLTRVLKESGKSI